MAGIVDKLKAMPRARNSGRPFTADLTKTQLKQLLEIRKLRKEGKILCSVRDIYATLKSEGYAMPSLSHFGHWLNQDG